MVELLPEHRPGPTPPCPIAFDPRRTAILPIGGDKTGDDRFYRRFAPLADRLHDEHVQELKDEGSIR